MLKSKNRMIYGILICILLCALSISANAEPLTAEETQDEPISGIELDLPSAHAAEAQGRSEIENIFPANEQPSANDGKADANLQSPDNFVNGNGELPIDYEQNEEKEAALSTSYDNSAENSWRTPIFIIATVLIALVLPVVWLIRKLKKDREENQ